MITSPVRLPLFIKTALVTAFVVALTVPIANAHTIIRALPNPDPEPDPGPCLSGSCPKSCDAPGPGGKIILRTGHEKLSRTDMVVNDVLPIVIRRHYASDTQFDSNLGYGWAFSHDFRLFEYPDGRVIMRHGCGIQDKFTPTGGNAYDKQAGGLLNTLTKNGDNTYTVTYLTGEQDLFDTQGRLTSSYDIKGNRLDYIYDNRGKLPLIGSSPNTQDPAKAFTVAYMPRLQRIEVRHAGTDALGNYVDITYNEITGRIDTITANDGRVITYQHDVTPDSLTKGNLIGVDGLDDKVSIYQYNDTVGAVFQDHHNITHIQEGLAATPYQLVYNAEDRVTQETYGYSVLSFDFTNYLFETTVTETIKDDQGTTTGSAVMVYQFDGVGYIELKRDALGNETKYTLNDFGLATKEEVYSGAATTGTLLKVIDRVFTGDGNKQSEATTLVVSGEIITTVWTYDGTQKASEITTSSLDPTKEFKTTWSYNHDANGAPTTVQEMRRYKDNGSDYVSTTYTYNAQGNLLTTTLPNTTGTHVIKHEYGVAYGERYITKTIHTINGVDVPDLEETNQYDTQGNRTVTTDARGHSTTVSYDNNNRVNTVTNPLNHKTTINYDDRGNIINIIRDRTAVEDQLDNTLLTYDGENRLTTVKRTDSGGTPTLRASLKYNSAGDVIAIGDAYASGAALTYAITYDAKHRLTRITDDQGNYIQYTLNALDQRTQTDFHEAGGAIVKTSSAVFDAMDRQLQRIGAANQITVFAYDADDNLVSIIDALNRPTTQYTYDTLSRLTNVNDANSKDTVYQYDDRDQLRTVTDPKGLTTQYEYNNLGQLIKRTSPDTGITEYSYDLVGNRKTLKDARNVTVTFAYDELDRIINKTYPDSALDVTYTYDTGSNGIGKLSTMQDKEGTTTYGYDERDNLVTRSRLMTTGNQTYLTQYSFDLNNQLVSVTYPSGRIVNYTRDTLGQVTDVTTTPNGGTPEPVVSNVTYLPFGVIDDMNWANGLNLSQTFDNDYRLTTQALGASYDRIYGYDDVDNITAITDNTDALKGQSFIYDNLDRLDDATGNYGILDYSYDDVGNRLSLKVDTNPTTNYAYSTTANQLDSSTGPDAHSYSYDANGSTKTKDGSTFTYDNTNRMVQYNDGVNITNYGFNGNGERVRKSGASTTLYHYDNSGNLLFETDAAGNTQVEYIWLGNQRLAKVENSNLYFMHTDHLGTVQLLTDSAGAVAWSGDYGPFGGVNNIAGGTTNNLRFPGQYYDGESGLYYNYFRTYDPEVGRYITSDPIGLLGGINTYAYVNDNPLTFYDPYGLYCLTQKQMNVIAGGVGGAVGGAIALGATAAAASGGNPYVTIAGAAFGAIRGGAAGVAGGSVGGSGGGAIAGGLLAGPMGAAGGLAGGTLNESMGGGLHGGLVGGAVGGAVGGGLVGSATGAVAGNLTQALLNRFNDCDDDNDNCS